MNLPSEWQIYERIREALNSGDTVGALNLIDDTREGTRVVAAEVACLEAECLDRQGNLSKAIDTLEYASKAYKENFWVYYSLAQKYRRSGQRKECIGAYRKAHGRVGWTESEKNGYVFLDDYFSSNIPTWEKWFSEEIVAAPISILEIGSWQGGSATWMLDKVVSKRGGLLTCVDTFGGSSEHADWISNIGNSIENIFDGNISASGHGKLCRKIVGYSQEVLRSLYLERFDFIYIDGAHEARYVIEDAVLAFGLINYGGYVCFDDYDFKFPSRPSQNSNRAIDVFLELYEDEITLVEKGRQVLIQKKPQS